MIESGSSAAPSATRIATWLARRGLSWPPGPSRHVERSGVIVAAGRLGDPEPGDGYHREHVRTIHLAGDRQAQREIAAGLCDLAGPRARLEVEVPAGQGTCPRALAAAGLEREAVLPRGWAGRPLEWWGRPGEVRPAAGPPPRGRRGRPSAPATAPVRVRVHGPGTRAPLERFLERLVPGRSYPPGTLLSDSERAETRRSGDLEAPWILGLDERDRVVGGVVLEADGRPERSAVLRVHVDVEAAHRGSGLSVRLLLAARVHAAALGATTLEADPRSGHRGALRCLLGAGFEPAGRLRGGWRMRTPTGAWEEDVVLLTAPAAEPGGVGAETRPGRPASPDTPPRGAVSRRRRP